jgi:hypothetical protein
MGIALQHPELFVARDRADLGNVQALLEQARYGFVAKVVKTEVG